MNWKEWEKVNKEFSIFETKLITHYSSLIIIYMKTKKDIVENWLPRYTGMKLSEFGRYIILVNFSNYVKLFAQWHEVELKGEDRSMLCATANNITIINFGMGSPNAATIMDLLTAIMPKAVLFLGKCGGLRHDKNKVGDK